ncbi:MAG: hypothetical protein ACRDQG_17045, partial [Pseudonocardiaceae bacterium]
MSEIDPATRLKSIAKRTVGLLVASALLFVGLIGFLDNFGSIIQRIGWSGCLALVTFAIGLAGTSRLAKQAKIFRKDVFHDAKGSLKFETIVCVGILIASTPFGAYTIMADVLEIGNNKNLPPATAPTRNRLITGDWDGDGTTTPGVLRKDINSNNWIWQLKNSTRGG